MSNERTVATLVVGDLVRFPHAGVGLVTRIHENDYGVFYNLMIRGELLVVSENELHKLTHVLEANDVNIKS